MRAHTCDPSLPPAPSPGAGFGAANDNGGHFAEFAWSLALRLCVLAVLVEAAVRVASGTFGAVDVSFIAWTAAGPLVAGLR